MEDSRRRIPSVDSLLGSSAFERLLRDRPRSIVVTALRRTLEALRHDLTRGDQTDLPAAPEIAAATERELAAMDAPSLRRVINATGIPLHTNLGRAPLAAAAQQALAEVARGYTNLEYDLGRGARGSRYDHCAALLVELTGAGGALVVNNNAAAVMLALNELAEGHGVIVSRGELVEIGGSFRVPDVIAKSGARLVEVGATNRTHRHDYEEAIGPGIRAILKVHRSNFKQTGFVAEVSIDELVPLAHRHELPVVHDLGSGLLADMALGLPSEPSVRDSLAAGADLVTFSGDKLLGGPQAGVILGRSDLVERIRRNPMLRALRVGKLTLAALEATLRLWRDEGVAKADVPGVAMITTEPSMLRQRAERLAGLLLQRSPDAHIEVVRDAAEVGGGSYPGVEIESWILRVRVPDRSETELEAACRAATPPVIGRVKDGALCLDPRTVLPADESEFVRAVADALNA